MPSTKKKGRAWLIRVHDGTNFIPLVAVTGKSLKINNSRIDVTVPDEANPEGELWRETLDDVKSLDASGDYKVVGGNDAQARLVTIAMSVAAEEQFEMVIPGVGTFAGWFSVNLEFGDDGAVTGSISLENNGKPTFTAEA